jgi:hemoglobin
MNLLYEHVGGREGIRNLLRHFYADVRQDALIGPIFNAQIKHWPHHLEIIASFWETLIGGPRTYAGPMPMKHVPLHLKEEHFERWLFLWQANCRAQLPIGPARDMIELANHIGDKLRLILGIPTRAPRRYGTRSLATKTEDKLCSSDSTAAPGTWKEISTKT